MSIAAVPGRLADRVTVVTGASSGNGRAIALRLAAEGAHVLCCDLTPNARPGGYDDSPAVPTHELIEQRGGVARFQTCDAGDERAVEEAVERAVALLGPLRICVLNAGIFCRDASIFDETADEHDRTMRVNERGVWLGCRAAARRFIAQGDGGRIVCVASISGLVGMPGEPSYCASKGAVVNLVRAAAVDLAAHRINVNAVCPGFIATAMIRHQLDDPEQRAQLERRTPWPRLGTSNDVAAAVAFLASDDAEWITGAALAVDGGYTCA